QSFREKCPERANFGSERESHSAEVCRLIPVFIEVFRALASRQRMFGEMQLAERVSAQPTTSMLVYQALGNRARSVSTNRYAISSSLRPLRAVSPRGDYHPRPARLAPPAAGRQHEQRRRWRVRQHGGCIGLSDQARRATQRRLKPPEWQQAQ